MDLSKLPKMSQTPRRPEQAPEQAESVEPAATDSRDLDPTAPPSTHPTHPSPRSQATPYASPGAYTYAEPMIGAQVWISGILGLLFVLLGLRFFRWLVTTATGGTYATNTTWTSGPNAGEPVGYFELQSFANLRGPDIAWTEMAMFLFGVALLLEAGMLIASAKAGPGIRKVTLAAALGATALATFVNVGVVIYLISIGLTLPLFSLLAAAFGGYMLMYLWRAWRITSGA